MKSIPPKRLLLYLLIAGWLPLLFLLFHLQTRHDRLKNLSDSLDIAHQELIKGARKHQTNLLIARKYKGTDTHYLEKQVENLPLLQSEVKRIREWIETASFLDVTPLQTRLSFLTGEPNQLSFREIQVEKMGRLNEMTEILSHSVEVESKDLIELLGKLECDPERPHLLITDFKLERRGQKMQQEVLSLDLKLIKREYL